MKFTMELCEETISKIVSEDLQEELDSFIKDLQEVEEFQEGIGIYSFEYEEEKEFLLKKIEAFRIVLGHYIGEWNIKE